ncbi:MAG: hypothetical protein IK079_05900, partial [Desulfovibrio sp.]|nr:hypothetical protein [Desulfovibrio sp.]
MAICYRGKYGSWQVYWKNPFSGKQESRSFPTKEEAERENSLVLHRLKYEPESFRKDTNDPEQEAPENKTLEQVYIEYLIEKQFNKKETISHRAKMRYPLTLYGKKPVCEIPQNDLEAVKVHYLSDKTNTRATAHDKLCILRTVMYYAVRKGYREAILFPVIPNPHYKKFVPPTPEELSSLFDAALPHIQRVIILGEYMGVRIGQCELFQLTWANVDLSNRLLRIHGSNKNLIAPWR